MFVVRQARRPLYGFWSPGGGIIRLTSEIFPVYLWQMKVSKVSKFASFGKIDGSMLSFGAAEGGGEGGKEGWS